MNGINNTDTYFTQVANAINTIVNIIFFFFSKKYNANNVKKIKYKSLCKFEIISISINGFIPYNNANFFLPVILNTIKVFIMCIPIATILYKHKAISILPNDIDDKNLHINDHSGPYTTILFSHVPVFCKISSFGFSTLTS